MGDWLDSKGKRLLLYIVLCVILFVVGALVSANIGEQVHEDTYVFGLLAGPICFAGSIFYFITYDTLYDDDDEKSVGQKIFLILGLIVNILIGGLLQILYFGAFDSAIDYSPWFFALAAPWLMSGLLTLDLYEFIFQSKSGGVKMLLPFISLVICYIIYLILGYNGRSSSFIYAGIGLIICGVLFVAFILKGVFRIIAENIALNKYRSQKAADTSKNKEPVPQKPVYSKKDFAGFYKKPWLNFSRYVGSYFDVSTPNVYIASDCRWCDVTLTLEIDYDGLASQHTGFSGIVDTNTVQSDINEAYSIIQSWFDSNVKSMPGQYSHTKFNLKIKEKNRY